MADVFSNQNQNSLLVKRQTENTTPGGMGIAVTKDIHFHG